MRLFLHPILALFFSFTFVHACIFMQPVEKVTHTHLVHARLKAFDTTVQNTSSLNQLYDFISYGNRIEPSSTSTKNAMILPIPASWDQVIIPKDPLEWFEGWSEDVERTIHRYLHPPPPPDPPCECVGDILCPCWLLTNGLQSLSLSASMPVLPVHTSGDYIYSIASSLNHLSLAHNKDRFIMSDEVFEALEYEHDTSLSPLWSYLILQFEGEAKKEIQFKPFLYLYPVPDASFPRLVPTRHFHPSEPLDTPIVREDERLVFARSGIVGSEVTPSFAKESTSILSDDEKRLIDWAYQVDRSQSTKAYRKMTSHVQDMFKEYGYAFEAPVLRVMGVLGDEKLEGEKNRKTLQQPMMNDMDPHLKVVDKDLYKLLQLEKRRVHSPPASTLTGEEVKQSVARLLLAYFAVEDYLLSHFRKEGVDLVSHFPTLYSLKTADDWDHKIYFLGEEDRLKNAQVVIDGNPFLNKVSKDVVPVQTHVDQFNQKLLTSLKDMGQLPDSVGFKVEGGHVARVSIKGKERNGDVALL